MQSPLLILLGLTSTVVAAPLSTDVALHHRRAVSETSMYVRRYLVLQLFRANTFNIVL